MFTNLSLIREERVVTVEYWAHPEGERTREIRREHCLHQWPAHQVSPAAESRPRVRRSNCDEGEGARPTMESTVKVHYRGSKLTGLEFDSSFARGVPEEFTVNSVLRGWQEVLPLMKTGATWQVFVPPDMAFGARGNPPVGPNEALTFDLKLVEIVK